MTKYDVNIDLANETKKEMVAALETDDKRVLNKVGAFASLYNVNFDGYKDPVLVLKTEEPGSKQIIAAEYDKIENVCYDMIHHLINDCIVMGAKPLTIQDAIICGKMDKNIILRIVKTLADACEKVGCVLTGGETSEQPGVLDENKYILTSSVVGIVDKNDIIDGSDIQIGDVVIALESSGIHTNGYTLVRKIMTENSLIMKEIVDGKKFIDSILVPHRCYYNQLKGLFGKKIIHGMAHITGGGICDNLNRILPAGADARIELNTYRIPNIFKVLRRFGNVSDSEMLKTFNLGVGMAIVTSKENSEMVIKHLSSEDVQSNIIGEIVEGTRKVVCEGKIKWE